MREEQQTSGRNQVVQENIWTNKDEQNKKYRNKKGVDTEITKTIESYNCNKNASKQVKNIWEPKITEKLKKGG